MTHSPTLPPCDPDLKAVHLAVSASVVGILPLHRSAQPHNDGLVVVAAGRLASSTSTHTIARRPSGTGGWCRATSLILSRQKPSRPHSPPREGLPSFPLWQPRGHVRSTRAAQGPRRPPFSPWRYHRHGMACPQRHPHCPRSQARDKAGPAAPCSSCVRVYVRTACRWPTSPSLPFPPRVPPNQIGLSRPPVRDLSRVSVVRLKVANRTRVFPPSCAAEEQRYDTQAEVRRRPTPIRPDCRWPR
ncbi:hypothetical protein B0T11DRAFT_98073 [Plectosphaerella cucumerina]|uniref:Uncharacterized protein n=1 Tax=Plectosphaerella cucumerina TaxID=40658 RepID=A0A8K0X0R7_9PEZI|nr:hypothetical protein B0T11DRAFT_98073 [Plectosphaerella cucumerina]